MWRSFNQVSDFINFRSNLKLNNVRVTKKPLNKCNLKIFQTFSGRHVLTAAHCCERPVRYVSLGEEGEHTVRVEKTESHPQFSSKTYKYDFCIATLQNDVLTDDTIKDDVVVAEIPDGLDCDQEALNMEVTGRGYYHGCKEK